MRHVTPSDIDVFHDREERVACAAISDAKTLEAGDYGERDEMHALYAGAHPEATQWADFGDFTFNPGQPEQTYYVGGLVCDGMDHRVNSFLTFWME